MLAALLCLLLLLSFLWWFPLFSQPILRMVNWSVFLASSTLPSVLTPQDNLMISAGLSLSLFFHRCLFLVRNLLLLWLLLLFSLRLVPILLLDCLLFFNFFFSFFISVLFILLFFTLLFLIWSPSSLLLRCAFDLIFLLCLVLRLSCLLTSSPLVVLLLF